MCFQERKHVASDMCSLVGKHISRPICVDGIGKHISLGISVSLVEERKSLGICVSQGREHLLPPICISGYRNTYREQPISRATHIPSDMCFPGRRTYITRGMC